MVSIEAIANITFDGLKSKIFEAEQDKSIYSNPSARSSFPSDILDGQWFADQGDSLSKENQLYLKEIVIRKLFVDAANYPESERGPRFAKIMDLCHHLRSHQSTEETSRFWTALFFELFRLTLSILSIPQGLLEFWPYVESRLGWFQSGYSLEVQYGQTNLSAIKAPFSRITFHVNKLLLAMREQSKLATPLHYELTMKIHWFLSQCLPPMEQANTNKRGIMAKSLPEQIWDWKQERDVDAPAFFTDLLKVQKEFVQNPLEWIFSDKSERMNLEQYLSPVLDELLHHESEFYAQIKRKQSRVQKLSKRLNFSNKATNGITEVAPKANATKLPEGRNISPESLSTLRPLLLDLPTWNYDLVMSQLQDQVNDFHRKHFFIQVIISSNLIERVLKDDATKSFYISQRKQLELSSKDLDKATTDEILGDLSHIIKRQLFQFYEAKDKAFKDLLEVLIDNETAFLDSKVKKGFKIFGTFNFPVESSANLPDPDYSFKGFGWIKLGNKKLDTAWKVKTGIENIKDNVDSPQILFNKLQMMYQEDSSSPTNMESVEDTVEQWKQMRSLRPRFMFQLSKVDEQTGIKGLFDEELIQRSRKNRQELRTQRRTEEKAAHEKKLQEARDYFESKKKRKFEAEEDPNSLAKKKQTPEAYHNNASNDAGSTAANEQTSDAFRTTEVSASEKSEVSANSSNTDPKEPEGAERSIEPEVPEKGTDNLGKESARGEGTEHSMNSKVPEKGTESVEKELAHSGGTEHSINSDAPEKGAESVGKELAHCEDERTQNHQE